VTAAALAATVASGTGLSSGVAINSTLVPPGATGGVVAGTNVTLALPPITLFGQTSAGIAAITGLNKTAGLVGATVTGPGVPAGTTVLAVTTPFVAGNNIVPATPGAIRLSQAITIAPSTNLVQ